MGTIIGILASIFTAVALLPQLIKIIREKKSEGISYLMLASLFLGLSLWIWYGCMKEDWIIIISNAFSLCVNISIVVLSFVYRER
ncbi:MAG: SemiSWEET transporter [Bacteroidetes bacterium]|nr:SemiSWEET transporter [Bacteroidota bacterium]